MRPEKFSEAMGEVDERYVRESVDYKKPAVKSGKMLVMRRILSVAACLCVAVGGIAGISAIASGGKAASKDAYYAETAAATATSPAYSGYNSNGAYGGAAKSDEAFAPQMSEDKEWAAEGTAAADYNEAPRDAAPAGPQAETAGESLADGSKIIYRADLYGETTDFDKTVASLKEQVKAAGGYFESQNISDNTGNYRTASFIIRIPSSAFETFCDGVGGYCHLTDVYKSAQNVSEQYFDIETRLKTARTKLERLQELMSKADNMTDIIEIENAITDTETTIEYLTGELRHYDSLIGYSTVDVSVREVYVFTDPEPAPLTMGERMSAAFRSGLRSIKRGFENCLVWIAGNWYRPVLWAAVIWVCYVVIRAIIKKSRG